MKGPRLLLVKPITYRPVPALLARDVDVRAPITGRHFDAVVRAVHRGHLPMESLGAVSDAWYMRKPLPDDVAAVLEGGPD
ncbi:hypothetical protein [Paraburkholderia diazotrophica]|uniref:Uncharacterized protein n=1 Tax=Paraburkholderia diazotrophica TaxID=667676 RepID=A0A1H6TXM7_9BURK|nr:hypothetical protein [Paraburkholderia diazotrophica]SEI80512.1 hypothetical protein SAMN05192539_1004166 [Paraburkholderia diazotrophica]